MSKLLTIILLVGTLLNLSFTFVYAQNPTATTSESEASPSGDMSRIEKIKEMVAQKVATLKLVEKKGIVGSVKDVATTQIILVSRDEQRIIDVDELTKFSDGTSKSFGISDIQKGDELSAIGLYNKETKHLLARFITKGKTNPTIIAGAIKSKDKVNFTLNVLDETGKSHVVNIETTTKSFEYQKGEGVKKSGFTRLVEGEKVLIVGFPDAKNKEEIIATRVLRFVDIPPAPSVKKHLDTGGAPLKLEQ